MPDKYIKMFTKLRTDRNRNLYPSFTGYRAPHKPFLLLFIMDLTNEHAVEWKEPEGQEETRVRDQGFRRAIVNLYDHRCALCGIRMLTPEGHTVVEAAHIVQWNESHNDLPTNGMALCRLCHWSFDEGLMSVGNRYEVFVSGRVHVERNLP